MKKRLISLSLSLVLLGISTTGSFAYRIWVDTYINGKLVSSKCGGSNGGCLPTVIIQ
ncbi:hypothetical protein SAMN03080617_01375 [Algoriphagus alkaliphilus]|uniref:Uncharacterized protein n=1 Tax=Algoriphagus alkaliphilus TaxID=279824 RepID=A0A1G5WX96_9BACT|nr:hypothetical protein [Algoriphagus alkaliphilus]SDA62642.1 hypothetical protein SAMN03080617_01375 [Algoriphagus alkaliphilus]